MSWPPVTPISRVGKLVHVLTFPQEGSGWWHKYLGLCHPFGILGVGSGGSWTLVSAQPWHSHCSHVETKPVDGRSQCHSAFQLFFFLTLISLFELLNYSFHCGYHNLLYLLHLSESFYFFKIYFILFFIVFWESRGRGGEDLFTKWNWVSSPK